MPVPLTAIHKGRVADQVAQNLVGLQVDMRRNAATHRAMALAQSPDLPALQGFVADCAAQYLRRLQWVIDLRNDPVRRQRLLDVLATRGWTEADIVDVVSPLRLAAIALRDAPRTSYTQIVTACDALLSAVDAPESLWTE